MAYRRKTVEALLRQAMREKEQLLSVIREQNDRIMLLAGKPWTPAPLDLHNVQPDDDPDEELVGIPDVSGDTW